MTDTGHDVARIAEDLVGAAVSRLAQVGGGRNSRVFRVETTDRTFALKLYPSRAEGARDRLGVETAALRWMAAHGFAMVPRVIAVDRDRDAALLSWADGDLVRDGVGESDVDQACEFLGRLHALRDTPAVPPEHLAAEACLSGAEIERQLRSRIHALRNLGDAELTGFLDSEAEPALAARIDLARNAIEATGGAFSADLPLSRRSQVPSDFGFHNALRGGDGRLTFIDFEYFGWDDPAKLVADILLHPGTPVGEPALARLRAGLLTIHQDDPGFAARLDGLLPLLGLRWALILLNEFHPERWRRRVMAGATETWAFAKQRQLAAARQMLHRHAVPRRSV